jgi:mRNA interferase RelE/StbE
MVRCFISGARLRKSWERNRMYSVQISKHALKQLKVIPKIYQSKIKEHIDLLEKDPLPHGHKKLMGSDNTYRIRVGVYRILYEVHHNELIIQVISVSHRKDAYRN